MAGSRGANRTRGNEEQIPSFIRREPADAYHAKASEHLSSHQLAEFRRCPLLHRRRQLGLLKDEDRPAYQVGRAAHTLILEGQDTFDREYAVGGPVNPKTDEVYGSRTKAYQDWVAEQTRQVLTDEQAALVVCMADSVKTHEVARGLLAAGVPEGVVRTQHCGVPCQIRMDWFDPTKGLVDLKTCDDLTWFEADARRYGYVHQLAFYRAVLAEVAGARLPVYLIAVEKREPYRCGVWRVGEDVLGLAEQENTQAIERLKRCRESGLWPTGYEEMRTFDQI